MISRRWIVQSGAIGVFGVTLVALPLWMGGVTEPSSERLVEDSPASEMVEEVPEATTQRTVFTVRTIETEEIGRWTGEVVKVTTRTIRTTRWRHHLVDIHQYQGPMCPVMVEIRPPDDS